MPRIKQTTVYQYHELEPDAQERARDWWREASAGDNYFSEHVTDEFLELLTACGFNTSGKDISWSGFSSQGDGASFAAGWHAKDCKPDAVLKDWPATYQKDGETITNAENKRWHDACAPLAALAARLPRAVGDIHASSRGFFMSLPSFTSDTDADEPADDAEAEEILIQAARDLARAYYRALEAAYEWENSDEQIAEAMAANEYEFTKEGKWA